MTAEERRAYVKGALTVCMELNLQEHLVEEVCIALKIEAEELLELRNELLAPRVTPFVPGILGVSHDKG